MNPNPLSIKSLAIVPVGIARTPPVPKSRCPALVELENRGQSRQVQSRKSRKDQPLAERTRSGYLPGFRLFLIAVLVVVVLVVLVEVIVVIIVRVINGMLELVMARHFVTYKAGLAAGSGGGTAAAGATTAGAGAGGAAGFGGG